MLFLKNKLDIKEKLIARRYLLEPEGCWLYTGYKTDAGYGQLFVEGKLIYVHRLSLYLYKDFDLNSKLEALHIPTCKRKDCWNPEHLYAGDQYQNNLDIITAGTGYQAKKTHCKQGHPFSVENTYIMDRGRGARVCKICKKNWRKRG